MILVFGKSGQVATELARQAGPQVMCLGRTLCNLMTSGAAGQAIARYGPHAVINAAAYTAVDQAEQNETAAQQINTHAVTDMAQTCAALGIPLIHISTDYVFAGQGVTPHTPDSPTAPLNVYGHSKLAAEHAIRGCGGVHVILRTSWVVSAHGTNFVKTMQRLAMDHTTLPVVADQIGGPTPAADIAAACLTIADHLHVNPAASGTYHFTGTPDVSWANFARGIFAQTGQACTVKDSPTADYPTPAKRPLNSQLDCSSTAATFNIPRPDWRQGVADIIKDLTP